METQELKMLNIMKDFEIGKRELSEFFNHIVAEFNSFDLAEILIMKLYNKGYIYTFVKENQFVLGNPKALLTDKGHHYLKSNKFVRWIIENGSLTVTWGNIIALTSFSIGIIFNICYHLKK